MNYDFTVLCYFRFLSGLIAVCLAFILLSKSYSRAAVFLAFFEFAAAIWAISDGFEGATTSIPVKLHWSQIAYTGITTSAVFFLMFALYYTQSNRFANRKTFAVLMIIPVITLALAFTNPYHKILWQDIKIVEGTNRTVYYYGFWFWIFLFYEYIALTTGIILLIVHTFRVYRLYRIRFWILLIGTPLPFYVNILYVFKLTSNEGIDLTPISFIFTGIVVALSLYWLKIFDILPIARQQAFDNLRVGMFVVDSADRIVDSNPAFNKISNLQEERRIGSQAGKVLSNININVEDFTEENDHTIETQIVIDGEEKYFEVKFHKILDKSQRLIGKIFIFNDITTRILILDAIADSNKNKKLELIEKEQLIRDLDAFARTVAHDLKNPVNTIVGFSELIKMKLSEDNKDEAIKMLNIVHDQSLKMSKIIDDLLKLAIIGKEDIKLVPVDSHKLIEHSLKRLEKLISESKTIISMPDHWPEVLGYPQWIEEVWVNLISNAIKYGGNPPEITLDYQESSPTMYQFWIRDNGNGLPSNSLVKIFEDFERLGKMDIEGHGLGLAIVKRIIEKLGGQVNVSSTNKPGEGCVFSFTLSGSKMG